jgi:hypothetical protein
MIDIRSTERYHKNTDLLTVEMDGDLVMMSIERGDYYGVSGIGPFVWKLIDTPATFMALVDAIVENFEIDAETASADLQIFLGELTKNGMVTVS